MMKSNVWECLSGFTVAKGIGFVTVVRRSSKKQAWQQKFENVHI